MIDENRPPPGVVMSVPSPMFGFLVELEVDDALTSADLDVLWRDFMTFVADRGLVADGGTGHCMWTYMIHSEASQATDADRGAVKTWVALHRDILAAQIGAITDLRDAA